MVEKLLTPKEIEERTKKKLEDDEKEHEKVRAALDKQSEEVKKQAEEEAKVLAQAQKKQAEEEAKAQQQAGQRASQGGASPSKPSR